MSDCPACGTPYRTGTLVVLIRGGHKPRGARVCSRCARNGMTIVAQTVAEKPKPAPRSPDIAKALRQLELLAKTARGAEATAKKDDDSIGEDYHAGRAEGFEGAIGILRGPK